MDEPQGGDDVNSQPVGNSFVSIVTGKESPDSPAAAEVPREWTEMAQAIPSPSAAAPPPPPGSGDKTVTIAAAKAEKGEDQNKTSADASSRRPAPVEEPRRVVIGDRSPIVNK